MLITATFRWWAPSVPVHANRTRPLLLLANSGLEMAVSCSVAVDPASPQLGWCWVYCTLIRRVLVVPLPVQASSIVGLASVLTAAMAGRNDENSLLLAALFRL
jgi:hypothetical protein